MRHQNIGNSSVCQPSTGHAEALEVLERAGQVEERLGARAHRDDRVRRDRAEIGADVAGAFDAAVDTADAAGGEHLDARGGRERERPTPS